MKKSLPLIIVILLSCGVLFAQTMEELENWTQQQTENFNAKDVVNFMNSSSSSSTHDSIIFGDSYIFSYEYSGRPVATYLDSTHFVVVYQPEYYVRHGTAVVGTVSGNTISYGDPYVFNNEWTGICYLTTLDSNHFVIAYWDYDLGNNTYYNGNCIVGTVSGENISFGAKYDFSGTVQILASYYGPTISLTSLDFSHFVLAYKDHNNFGFGASMIGTVSGNIISYGAKYVFNQGLTTNISTTSLDTNLFVIAYYDSSYYGTAIVGNVLGTNISYNSKYVFHQGGSPNYSICNLDSNHFVIVYRGLGLNPFGNVILGTLYGPEHIISYSDTYVFSYNWISNISTSRINEYQFLIAYVSNIPDTISDKGTAIVGSTLENNIVFGSESIFHQGVCIPSATTLSEDRIVVAYLYHTPGTPASFFWGKANVGIILNSPIISSVISESVCPDSITIPITVQDMNDVTDFSLIINYDTTNISFIGYQNFNTQLNEDSLSVTDINGEITIAWNSATPVSIESDTLIGLLFSATNVYNQITANFIWDDTNSYYLDSTGVSLVTIFNNGQITINPIPADAGLITGADNICQGTGELIYHIDSIPNANIYNWSLIPDTAGEIIGSDTIITINFSDSFYGEATLSVYGSNTCGDGISSSLIINVIANPTSNAGYDDEICEGESYTLSGSASNCTHTYWNTFSDGSFDDPFILNATYTPGSGDIQNGYADLVLFAYAISPCLGEVGDTMTLIIEQKPIAVAGENAEICEGGSYMLSGFANNYSSILWTTSGDGVFDDPAFLAATYSPGTDDISLSMVNLILTAYLNSPCTGEEADTLELSIINYPEQPQIPKGPIAIDLDATQTSEYTITQAANATSYEWFLEPYEVGFIGGADTIGTVYWNSGYVGLSAYVYVVAINDCGELSSDTLAISVSPVGISNSNNNKTEIRISPNPSDGSFNISIKGATNDIDLTVMNSEGQIILQKKLINTTDNFVYKIDISNNPSGNYFLKFEINNSNLYRRVIIF